MNLLRRVGRLLGIARPKAGMHRTGAESGTRKRPDVPGYLRGRHYSDYTGEVRELEGQGRLEEAEELLCELVEAVEGHSIATGMGVAPSYYERLAIIYRKQRRLEDEIEVLERFAAQRHAPGRMPAKLSSRLDKARRMAGAPAPEAARRRSDAGREAEARSPIGSAEEFMDAIGKARHYGGKPVVSEDAPARTRAGKGPS
jgi:hypothetical protein